MNLLRSSLAGLLLLGAGAALAHAELETATPAQNSTVTTLPSEITLTFSEAVEVGFSLFKVYKLDATVPAAETTEETTPAATQDEDHSETGGETAEGHAEDDMENSAEGDAEDRDQDAAANADATPPTPEQLRLNGLAGTLVAQVLETKGDEAARADAGVATEATSKTVTLNLKPDLAPGTYVVMWRALSVDTHSEQGYYVFTYQPTP